MVEGRPPALVADLSGFSHFVASRQGLYVVNQRSCQLFAAGAFFGLTLRDSALYAFEQADPADSGDGWGRIVRFDLHNCDAQIVHDALPYGCHQIDFIGDVLFVVDTYNQRLLRFAGQQRLPDWLPLPPVSRDSGEAGYCHLNSITARGERIYLLLHMGGQCPSEIRIFDRNFRTCDSLILRGSGCHNIVLLEDGEMLCCGSMAGALISDRGLEQGMIPGLMTRGLAVDSRVIAVGSSLFGLRHLRGRLPGVVRFLDRAYQRIAEVAIPGSPTDIRCIRGADLSLANVTF